MKIANFEAGLDKPFFLIAGPCVIESRAHALEVATMVRDITGELGINALYKSSFDKANRTSGSSFRGPGIQEGLEILQEVRETTGMPVLTDVHTPEQIELAAKYVDMLQTPAFLCRQTDLIEAAGACGIPVNIKKGQFLSPPEMINVTKKAQAAGAARQADALISEQNITGNIVLSSEGPAALLQELLNGLKKIHFTQAAFLIVDDGDKLHLGALCGKDGNDQGHGAGNLIKDLAPLVGGKGGGKPDMARGAAPERNKLEALLTEAKSVLLG